MTRPPSNSGESMRTDSARERRSVLRRLDEAIGEEEAWKAPTDWQLPTPLYQGLQMFFTKKCPRCGSRLRAGECNACAPSYRDLAPPRPASLRGGTVEISLLVDATGSGQAFAEGVTIATRQILTAVERRVGNLTISVQTHRDEDFDEMPEVIVNGADAEKACAEVGNIDYTGGGDWEETHLSAIETAINRLAKRPRRTEGSRVMLAFLNAETKPARSGRSPAAIGSKLRKRGVILYLVCEPTEMLREFCDAAGGMMVKISNNPSAELMQAIADRVAMSVAYSVSMRSVVPIEPVSQSGALRLHGGD